MLAAAVLRRLRAIADPVVADHAGHSDAVVGEDPGASLRLRQAMMLRLRHASIAASSRNKDSGRILPSVLKLAR
jgi:hypothetical protein